VIAAIAGLVGAVATAIGFSIASQQAAFAYLVAWAFAMSIVLGALCLLAVGHASGAKWSQLHQPRLEQIVRTLPVLAVLFVPIALSVHHLYAWTDLARFHGDDLAKLEHKSRYLNVPFWCVRAAIALAVWVAIGELLVRTKNRALAAAALPILALTLTFAAFDWLMSLTPLWYSTIYGLIYFGGGFVAALALLAIRQADRDLGRLMFAFLVFWAYLELAQGLIIWLANKPDEVPWYVARGAGGWGGVFALLAIGGFVVPFFALISHFVKGMPRVLAAIGVWLLAMHFVDVFVMPVLHAEPSPHWLDLAAPCGICGIAITAGRLRG
jgi:hypothetical protein